MTIKATKQTIYLEGGEVESCLRRLIEWSDISSGGKNSHWGGSWEMIRGGRTIREITPRWLDDLEDRNQDWETNPDFYEGFFKIRGLRVMVDANDLHPLRIEEGSPRGWYISAKQPEAWAA